MQRIEKPIIIVMGVSGCGKSTLGQAIAAALGVPFVEGDDYHPESNVAKMSQSIPLDDTDRWDWLHALWKKILEQKETGAVIACSALKEIYRQQLSHELQDRLLWILLNGNYEKILSRIQARKGHFMPPALLRSQVETLEIPDYAFQIDVDLDQKEQVRQALSWIKKKALDTSA